MQGMSERQYAAHAGLSRGAIQKAKAAGRLVLHGDGSIDATASDARRKVATDPAKQRSSEAKPPKLKPVPDAAVSAVSDTLREQPIHHKDLLPVNYVVADMAGRVDSPLYGMFAIRPRIAEIAVPGGGTLQEWFVRPPDDGSDLIADTDPGR